MKLKCKKDLYMRGNNPKYSYPCFIAGKIYEVINNTDEIHSSILYDEEGHEHGIDKEWAYYFEKINESNFEIL